MHYSMTHHYSQLLVLLLLSCWIGASSTAPLDTAEERNEADMEEAKKRMTEEEARPESRQGATTDEDDYPSRSFLPAMYLHQQSPPFHRRPSVVDLSGGRTLVNVPKGGYVDGEPAAAVDENGSVVVFQPREPSSPSHSNTAVQQQMQRQRNYPAAWDKRAQTFVRFGKRAQTFVRFGKRAQTFVRFG